MMLELLPTLCTFFKNYPKCKKISFNSDSFSETAIDRNKKNRGLIARFKRMPNNRVSQKIVRRLIKYQKITNPWILGSLDSMDPWSSHLFPEILNQFLTQESCKSAKNSWGCKLLKFKFVRKLRPEASKWHF